MFKKFIYGLVVVAMLAMAFGVKGVGVQTAKAADQDQFTDTRMNYAVDTLTVPYFNNVLVLNNANADQVWNLGGCLNPATSFGAYQLHANETRLAGNLTYHYVHVRVEAIPPFGVNDNVNSWAVLVSQGNTSLTELGCQLNSAGGIVDMIVPVPNGYGYVITIASNGIFVPDGQPFKVYVAESMYATGGLLVDMTADCGDVLLRNVEATNQADANNGGDPVLPATDPGNGRYYQGVPVWTFPLNQDVFFLDLLAGTYNLGIEDQTANAEFAAYYPNRAVLPNFITLTPCADAVIPLDVHITDWAGAAQDVETIALTPSSFGLNHDLELGSTHQGTEAKGEKTFFVNPGYLWDIAAVDDSNMYGSGYNIFLIERAFNPTLGSLLFNIEAKPAAWVALCVNPGYTFALVNIDPPGQLEERIFNFKDGYPECAAGYTGGLFGLTAGQDYDVSHSVTLQAGRGGTPNSDVSPNATITLAWLYEYIPSIPIWNFAGNNMDWAYFQYFGDVPFLTTPEDGTSQPNYNLPLVGGQVKLMRGPWTDQDGNTVKSILAPDDAALDCLGHPLADTGTAPDVIKPCYVLQTVLGDPVILANDWLTTNLGPATHVGRYRYTRSLQHGTLPMAFAHVDAYKSLFTINPSDDVTLAGHWSWPWVMAMYEYGLTTGLVGGTYNPDQPVTRAEMAVFLGRVMDMYNVHQNPATTAAFGDVPAGYWAAAAIDQLADYNITNGCGSNMYCPEASVTRAEMAKFIESTFRTIKAYGGNDFYWDEEFNILVPGLTFADVPEAYWANTWIEELFWDNLTSGCRRDDLTLYFCPDASVTRGEMAKFIITAIQPDSVTLGFWPILSPSK